jgi:hypothetical protein
MLDPLAPLDCTPVTPTEALAALRHKLRGSRDPDGISPRALRILPAEAVSYVADVATYSLRYGVVPAAWWHSVITPVPKPGKDLTAASGYRPVAMTSLLSRTMERIIARRTEHIFQDKLRRQHGFLRGRNSASALAHILEPARKQASMSSRAPIEAQGAAHAQTSRKDRSRVYMHKTVLLCIDMTDAFTRIPHAEIIKTMREFGFDEVTIRWVTAWLLDRTFAVRHPLEAVSPNPLPASRGVPQGSVLGPLLFLLIMHILSTRLEQRRASAVTIQGATTVYLDHVMYADDLTIIASAPHVSSALRSANAWLKVVQRWARDMDVPISETKSTAMVCTKDADYSPTQYQHLLEGVTLTSGPICILGVWVNQRLDAEAHRAQIMKTVTPGLHMMERASWWVHPRTSRTLYTNYVLSHLLYAPSIYQCDRLDRWDTAHYAACRLISGAVMSSPAWSVVREAGFRSLKAEITKVGIYEMTRLKTVDRQIFKDFPPAVPVLTCLPYDVAGCDDSRVHFHIRIPKTAVKNVYLKRLSNELRLRGLEPSPPTAAGPWLATDGTVPGSDRPDDEPPRRPAAAAVISDRETPFVVVDRSEGSPSPKACSYSTECEAGLSGLQLLRRDLEARRDRGTPARHAYWITDSLALGAALAKGPLRQTGTYEVWHWRDLLDLNRDFDVDVHIVFVYSHVGYAPNEAADTYADELSLTPAPPETRMWWNDYARYLAGQELMNDDDEEQQGAAAIRQQHGPPGPWFVAKQRISAADAKDLARLRVGLHPSLCSLDHYTPPSACPHCGNLVMGRGGTAVTHMFACTNAHV